MLLTLFGAASSASAQEPSDATPAIEPTEDIEVDAEAAGDGETQAGRQGGFEIQAAGDASLQMTVRTCPAGYDLAAGTLDDCGLPVDGVGVSVDGDGGSYGGTTGDAGTGSGAAIIDPITPGAYTVSIVVEAGSTVYPWSCKPLGDASWPSTPPPPGNSLALTLEENSEWLCQWYLVPPADVPGDDPDPVFGMVRLHKYTCPGGVTRTDDESALIAQCTVVTGPVDFTVAVGDGYDETGPLSGSSPLSGTWYSVPLGTATITEHIPAGYGEPLAFCTDMEADGPGGYDPVAVTGGSISIEHRSDAEIALTCLFFNFEEEDDPGDASQRLVLAAKGCPAGFDPATDALLDCTTDEDGVQFAVSGPSGAFTGTTGDLASGAVDFTGLAPGDYTIAMTVPPGAASVFVWDCSKSGVPTEIPSSPLVIGDSVTLTIEAGFDYLCRWYIVPGSDGSDETGIIRVSKYSCPAGVERSTDDYLLSEQCREEIDPVRFDVSDSDGTSVRLTLAAGVPQHGEISNLAFGTVWIGEHVPPGYGALLAFCSDTPADGPGVYEPVPVTGSSITVELRADAGMPLTCLFFNFPETDPGNIVTVNKYVCPSWVNPETDVLLDACAPGGDGIPFAFVDGNGRHNTPVSGGTVAWTDVVIGVEGELQIIEDIPAGYGDPWVVCDGILMASAGGFVIPNPGDARPFHVECDWFNIALEDGALAAVKHTCAPGYDLHAAGADPMIDCPELTDGVDFHIAGMGADMTSTTGDAGPGMVQFGGLDPGAYTLTETVPGGTVASFVLDCFGNDIGAVRPYPLAAGNSLDLTIHAGEAITCHWFNVPEVEGGGLTVVKYLCTGETYESDVDCQIQEDGVVFDLVVRDGDAWVVVGTATTDTHGRIAWIGLEPGRYWLDERDGVWCHIASTHLAADSTGIAVEDGDEAVVKVYNCGAEPGKPGETPEKFPDTGVPPAGGAPAIALAGLLALPLTRRRLGALAAVSATGIASRAVAQHGDQEIEPADGTAGPRTVPGTLCLPSPEDGCERGPVPATLRIDAIGVDAPIEILETVAGEMQQPTDEGHVAWYKETARLGEPGNMLLAGHFNWWGVPEAVFYNLARLREGDEIVITGDEGEPSLYAVEWVRQLPAGNAPGDDVLGMTAMPTATLITCAGAWDAAASSYESRTVVRAHLVEAA